jgi:hypothetical protein
MNFNKLITKKLNLEENYNTVMIIKNRRELTSINTNINIKVIDDIMCLYLTEPNNELNLHAHYKLDIWKGEKNFMSICSFDHNKLEKVIKLLNYNFLK